MHYKIRTVYIVTTIALLIINTLIIGYFWINTIKHDYSRDHRLINQEYIESQKSMIKREVNSLVLTIDIEKNNINTKIKTKLLNKIELYTSILNNINYDKQKIVNIFSLKDKYFYVFDKNGNSIIDNGFFTKNELLSNIEILSNQTEGFVSNIKEINNKTDKIISYVKYINGMYIGVCSLYSEDENETKQELLNKINSIKYTQDGYFFIINTQGVTLLNPAQPELIGKNLYNLTSVDGQKIVQNEINVANTYPNGEFLYYTWYKPTTKIISPKISFIKKIPDFDWILGTGVYLDTIESTIKEKEKNFEDEIKQDIKTIILVLVLSTLIAIIVLSFLSNRLKNSFDTLNDFFKKATKQSIHINSDDIFYDEFKILCETINIMLEEKIKAELELLNINKELENTIEKEIKNRREKELLLIQQAKMASIGEMIGNIAHQWRQPLSELSTIYMNINFKYSKGELSKEYLQQKILQSENIIEYMSNTIDDFRNFYSINKVKIDFNVYQSCVNVLNILKSLLKYHHINYIINIENTIFINGCKNEFEQALLNIVSNAKDVLVINQIENPTIKIYTRVSNKDIAIVIEDNGGGIKINPIEKIFEPYFTTKHQYKGTGIGLYMSKIIIENNFFGLLKGYNIAGGARFEIIFDKEQVKDSKKTV